MSRPPGSSFVELSRDIHEILLSRKLSMAEISRQSRLRFGASSLFWIPSHFYEAMRHGSFSPSLHQLFAFSVLTNYRLTDWVRLFGFSLDAGIPFQVAWPRRRTVELDARLYHPEAELPWFEEAPRVVLGDELTPLNRWLFGRKIVAVEELAKTESRYRYFKIGQHDAYAYPDLLPGSIVRVNSSSNVEALLRNEHSEQIVAVEHRFGVTCSHVKATGGNKIVLCSKQLPYPPVEVSLGTEARLLGVVDLEIRRLVHLSVPIVSTQSTEWLAPEPLGHSGDGTKLGQHLRRARIHLKLSFQAASELSREIAHVLGHPRYFCAASALSDIEASDRLPRHIHKVISLSAIYGVPLAEVAARAGLSLEAAGKEAVPLAFGHGGMRTGPLVPSRFAQAVLDRFGELPLFLHSALCPLTCLSRVSVRDIFWAGTSVGLSHPYLRNAAFLAVNRKSKQPAPLLTSPIWAQPLYLIELRDGSLLCAACTLHGETLLIRPCTASSGSVIRLRNHNEAEILGKVVALVRTVGDLRLSGR